MENSTLKEHPVPDWEQTERELKQAVEEYFKSKYFADFSKWRQEWLRINREAGEI